MEPLLNAVYYGEDRKDGRSNRLCSPLGQMVSTCIADQLAASDGRRKMGQRESARRNTMVRRIAIVGGGVSGLGAAWALHHHRDRFNFRLFEAQEQFGGNAVTAYIPQDDGSSIPFDISVNACIPSVYHHVLLLLEKFGIELIDTKFSYSVHYGDGVYATISIPKSETICNSRFRKA